MERAFFSVGLRSPIALGMPYVCAEKTSAVMVFCGEKSFGGDDEVELLMEPVGYGLLERFEGLVLVGLGPPAILPLSCGIAALCWRQRAAVGTNRDARGEQRRRTPEASAQRRVPGRAVASGRKGGHCLVKQSRNVVGPGSMFRWS
jgi:hypothetical protein